MLSITTDKFHCTKTWAKISHHAGKNIIIIDDVDEMRDLASMFFLQQGDKILTVAKGPDAVALCRAKRLDIGLVIVELIMPGMSGTPCLEKPLKINPHLKVIIISGDMEAPDCSLFNSSNERAMFQRPFAIAELAKTIHRRQDKN